MINKSIKMSANLHRFAEFSHRRNCPILEENFSRVVAEANGIVGMTVFEAGKAIVHLAVHGK